MLEPNEIHRLADETASMMRSSGATQDGVEYIVRHHLEGLARYGYANHHDAYVVWLAWCSDNDVATEQRLRWNSGADEILI